MTSQDSAKTFHLFFFLADRARLWQILERLLKTKNLLSFFCSRVIWWICSDLLARCCVVTTILDFGKQWTLHTTSAIYLRCFVGMKLKFTRSSNWRSSENERAVRKKLFIFFCTSAFQWRPNNAGRIEFKVSKFQPGRCKNSDFV